MLSHLVFHLVSKILSLKYRCMTFSEEKTIDVTGVGNALMDLLVEVEDAYVAGIGLEKGNTYFVDSDRALQLLEDFEEEGLTAVPGGAAANAVKGVAVLGGTTALFAAVGRDTHGENYIRAMQEHGVSTHISQYDLVTGHALTFITPDAERTFSDHLGATLELRPEDIKEAEIAKSKILHLEAYQLEGDTQATVREAIRYAKKHGTLISMDLADPALIERNKELFTKVVTEDIDILFCNEEEGAVFTGLVGEAALKKMGALASVAVLKLGEKGSLIYAEENIIHVDAVTTDVVDTTGAGDLYASGFLYGCTHGWDIAQSGVLGAHFASEVIARIGVDVTDIDTQTMLKTVTSS